MNICDAKLVSDLRIFETVNVSREHGRKRRDELAELGVIHPRRTPTGRYLLTFKDATRLAVEL